MIPTINKYLLPIEDLIKNNRKYIGYFLIFLSFISLGFLLYPNSTKDSGGYAITLLWIILWIPIFSRVFGLQLAQTILPLRKELGILMGTLAFVHGAGFMIAYPSMIVDTSFWFTKGFLSYTAFGFAALLLTIPLALTSSSWAMVKLGKNWKRLHRLVYIIIILVVAHVVLLRFSRNFEIVPVIFLCLYFAFKVLEWRGIKLYKIENKIYPIGQQWLCVPCGYIYDPLIGDVDSGVVAGTEFSDIPDDWRCPVCGVTRADFVPYVEGQEQETQGARIVSKRFLNPTTIELIIETASLLIARVGQFVSFVWRDDQGEFTRQYSIVRQYGKQFIFLIKLDEQGRGSQILRNIVLDTDIRIKGVFGTFQLQDSNNPKVFIATGTGLAPIYNMITSILAPVIPGFHSPKYYEGGMSRDPAQLEITESGFLYTQEGQKHGLLRASQGQEQQEGRKISLYFSVATAADLFYIDELRAIEGLDLHIHTTREQVEGYEFGRVDVDTIPATPETEWYFCGNPRMVTEAADKLTTKGYTRIYREEF